MSIYKPAGSPFYHYDFRKREHRFYGSTKCTNRREAEAFEREEKKRAEQRVAEADGVSVSLRLDDIAGEYWRKIGQHKRSSRAIWHRLGPLVRFFGKDKLITEITDLDVENFVTWRRNQRVRPKSAKKQIEDYPLVTHATVNREIAVLRVLFNTAATKWRVKFADVPNWKEHWLEEPPERVRELSKEERERLVAATRADYLPFFAFMAECGQRVSECLLDWSDVNWETGQIMRIGKGGRPVIIRITSIIREILWPLRGHHPEKVFTFVAAQTSNGRTKGQRYPITFGGAQSTWAGIKKRAKVTNFRMHDYRHDFATKLLRRCRNLKLVQRALNQASIESTMRYAHVLDSDLVEALEDFSRSRN